MQFDYTRKRLRTSPSVLSFLYAYAKHDIPDCTMQIEGRRGFKSSSCGLSHVAHTLNCDGRRFAEAQRKLQVTLMKVYQKKYRSDNMIMGVGLRGGCGVRCRGSCR